MVHSVMEKKSINIAQRVQISVAVVFLGFFVLGLRLWFLQIVKGDYFRTRSETNRIRTVYTPAPRGELFDRSGKLLVSNRASFNIELVTEDCPDIPLTLSKIERLLKLRNGSLSSKKLISRKRKPFEPKVIKRDVSREVVAKIAANRYDLPGVFISAQPVRNYVYSDLAAHSIGYIREISQTQLNSERHSRARYRLGDTIGQYGLESRLEDWLRGTTGRQLVEVNARGALIRRFAHEPERIGHDVHLTLNLAMQQAADQALRDKAGAVVAIDVNTGELLTLASSPTFDPNMFTGSISPEEWTLLNNDQKRLNHRALQGAYPPGSVFKMIMAVAGLSEGVVTPATTVRCNGKYHFAGRDYHCHKRSGHGLVDLDKAMMQSCDVYFYTLGNRLGIDRIHDYSTRFGLGTKTGLKLGFNEVFGLVPSKAWKSEYYKNHPDKYERRWYPGETLSVAIGQGALTSTPIQFARALAALVNGGKLLRPRLVKRVISNEGVLLQRTAVEQSGEIDLDPGIAQTVMQSMVSVVHAEKGTGKRARMPEESGILIGGKTGTAQVVALKAKDDRKEFEHHAWFMSFAPAENPEIVVVVLVEHGGQGGQVAAPVAREVLAAYFGIELERELEA